MCSLQSDTSRNSEYIELFKQYSDLGSGTLKSQNIDVNLFLFVQWNFFVLKTQLLILILKKSCVE